MRPAMTTLIRVLASVVLVASAGALAVARMFHGQRSVPLIAFEKTVGRKTAEIWVMTADGSNSKKLRKGCCFKWSPDGSQIAFHGWGPGEGGDHSTDFDLYVMRANGTAVRRLARYAWGTGLAWSPDGKKIVFVAGGGHGFGTSALYLVNADGSGLTQLTALHPDERDVEPAWAADGRRIAFARVGRGEIVVVNSDGSDLQVITPGVDHAEPSVVTRRNSDRVPGRGST